jgi:hypothetical protein
MTAATEAEIKQWIIREFRMMDAETVITGITLERFLCAFLTGEYSALVPGISAK